MTDWFRSWHGAPTDPKWLGIAKRAGVSPGIAVAVAWALMDRASQAAERGCIEGYDADGLACFFGCEPEQVNAIVTAMTDKAMIADGRFTSWEKRQPKREDGAAERAREWRERNRTQPNAPEPPDTEKIQIQKEKKKEGRSQATRLPADWTCPVDWLDEAFTAGMSLTDAIASSRRMHNWSLSDPKGKKLDWHATWRNWFQRDLPKPHSTASPAPRNAGERAFLKLQGQNHEPPDTAPKRMEAGDGRRQIEGYGDAGAFAGAQGSFGRN